MRDYIMVVGSGMMGSGIGAMSALAGNKTILADVDEARVRAGVERASACIDLRKAHGLNTEEEAEKARQLIEPSIHMLDHVDSVKMVIEAIVEDVGAKQNLFAELDKALPAEVPICSNTSGLRITDISAKCKHPERTVTTHFWLPAHLVPLVEVVMGEKTDRTMAEHVRDELKKWNKSPVLVQKDLPGQLANRIFQAMIREAVSIVASGLASAEDVDTAISCGMAMRFPEWGPLKHLDAIGLNLGLAVQETVLPDICADKQANEYLRVMVKEGNLGAETGKGFYDWTKRSMVKDMAKRDQFIIEAVKIVSKLDRE